MKCTEARKRIAERIGQFSLDAEASAHVAECPECARRLAEARGLDRLLADARPRCALPQRANKGIDNALRLAAARERASSWVWRVTAATSAVALLALALPALMAPVFEAPVANSTVAIHGDDAESGQPKDVRAAASATESAGEEQDAPADVAPAEEEEATEPRPAAATRHAPRPRARRTYAAPVRPRPAPRPQPEPQPAEPRSDEPSRETGNLIHLAAVIAEAGLSGETPGMSPEPLAAEVVEVVVAMDVPAESLVEDIPAATPIAGPGWDQPSLASGVPDSLGAASGGMLTVEPVDMGVSVMMEVPVE